MSISNYKPYGIRLTFEDNPIAGDLTSPYSLVLSYDPDIPSADNGVAAIGITNGGLGAPVIINRNTLVIVKPAEPQTLYGRPLIYNLLQVQPLRGFVSSTFGRPYLIGGVKWLSPRGIESSTYGKPLVINTTANQEVKPTGIAPPLFFGPVLSPRTIWATGFNANAFGVAAVVKTPMIEPKGYNQSSYGVPTIWFHTRLIALDGIDSYDTGYPVVYDPTQEIQAISLVTSAIFGDTSIKNTTVLVYPAGFDTSSFSDYSTVTNTNRYYAPDGIDSQAFGDTLIYNKTPSIFVSSINQTEIGTPAIGYAVRYVGTTGFDRLLLGKPTLTKTPELLPKGFSRDAVGTLFISNKIRTILVAGHSAGLYGLPTLWFRYRYVSARSWASSRFGAGTLTHGVREIISHGFIRQAYGNAWVSQGTRRIEPIGIYKINPTNHMVGGTRYLKPVGFIATEFGTRIIPENQHAYPQGFAGKFGLAVAYLSTQHIRPVGYISVGQQPADRWGKIVVFNSRQYIQQDYDSNSQLTPPKWSDWTAIENRNKNFIVSGFLSQRFGYTKIDNNAAPVLPPGIAPPVGGRYDVSMIAHSVRFINPDPIEAPPVSSWLVAYNDARIISPQGGIHSQFGYASAEKTRRYFRDYGRIDSLEMGVPVIGHAIRTIDIEPRYGIMPPQINMPTVSLWTKYASFRGFETAAYGTPSLSIHFNIIAPSWRHRDNVGEPAIRNLTPELGIYGHDSSEFGIASVRTQWRTVSTQGDNSAIFGAVVIADTKREIKVRGWIDTAVSQKPVVIKTGAPPYSEQRITLDGHVDIDKNEYVSGYGISSDSDVSVGVRIPKPGLNQNVLYPKGFVASAYGTAFMWSNNIRIISGINERNVSTGATVENKNNSYAVVGINNSIVVGTPSVSPHTIYAVREAPDQAKRNHKYQALHYVNETRDYPPGARFGRPKVESTIRTVAPKGASSSLFGTPSANLFKRYLKPKGFRRSLFGVPSIPFVPQYIAFEKTNNLMSLYGKPVITVSDFGPKEIKANGIGSLAIGIHTVDLKTRYILVVGHNSQAMGSKKNNDKPFMWQGLRVGEHVPLIIGGDDMAEFGDTFISHLVRNLELEGFNSFTSEYDINNFGGRMKIANATTAVDDAQYVNVTGFMTDTHGYSSIKLNQQFIRPDGNSDQFRKGAF